ncbi:energy-coupling factor transporter transmembrane component T family protein [Synergistes jonesii]|uniref:energy-coupling factor transporter transmembrane component T family protein n=1 Tax=Synergistes jonesii TaxID=2754 RepID=UPI00331A17EF
MARADKVAFGQFIPADTPVHALDPRAKIIMATAVIVLLFVTRSAATFLLWLLLLLFLSRLSKIPASTLFSSARPVLILIIFTSLLHIFATPGELLFRIFGLSATKEGFMLAFLISLRLALLVMYASLLTLTTSPARISDGLEGLMSPLARIGVPAHDIAMMITIALRFIPTLFEETSRIIKAQKSRGADFETGGPMKRARAYIPVLVPLFVIIFRRAENLAVAMEARGYGGGSGRTKLKPLRWRRSDSAAIALLSALSALIICGERFLAK